MRVRLSDHTTRTMEAVTDDILTEAGWSWVEPVILSVDEQTTSGTFSSEG